MSKAGSFLLYTDYINAVAKMSDVAAGRLFKAILAYVNGKELPTLSQVEETAFCFIRAQLDAEMDKQEKRRIVNAANGAKGGRPKKIQVVGEAEGDGKDAEPEEPEEQSKPEEQAEPTAEQPPVQEAQEEKQAEPEEAPKRVRKPAEKPPKKKYAEFVSLTEREHEKLIERFGEAATIRMIEILDNYKGQSNRRYASDYRAILNWVSERYEEEQARRQTRRPAPTTDPNHVDTDEDWLRFYQEGYRS